MMRRPDRQPRGLEAQERRRDLALVERRDERRRVVRRLGDAGCDMRPRDEGRIADDRDPAECHARAFRDRRSAAGSARRSAARSRGIAAPAIARPPRASRRSPRGRISGGGIEIVWVVPCSSVSSCCSSVALVGGPVPDHVVAAVARAQIVVGTRHRIAQALLARRQAERHVLEQLAMDRRRKRLLGDERAPGHVAGIERRELRQALLADGGAHDRRRRPADRPPRVPPSLKCAITERSLCSKRVTPRPRW